MPHIVVMADQAAERDGATVMLRERVNVTDFESAHFASQLVERLGWAVGDADEAERAAEHAEPEPTTHDAHADLAPTTQSETVEPAHAIAR